MALPLQFGLTPAYNPPASISNMLFRYRGSDLVDSNGAEISGWPDSSGKGFYLTNIAGPGDRCTVSTNALNGTTVASDAGKHGLAITAAGVIPTVANVYSICAVVKFTVVDPGSNLFFCFGNGSSEGMRIGTDTSGRFVLTIPNVGDYPANESPSLSTWHSVIVVSNAGTITVYLDTVALTWASGAPTAGLNGSPSSIRLCEAAGSKFTGSLAELVAYDQALSSGDRTKWNDYVTSARIYAL